MSRRIMSMFWWIWSKAMSAPLCALCAGEMASAPPHSNYANRSAAVSDAADLRWWHNSVQEREKRDQTSVQVLL